MLPALPVPGTPAFAQLCRELKRFGFSAEKFSIETPSAKLSDIRVTVALLQDAISLRIYYEWFELVVPTLIEGQDRPLPEIISTTLQALTLLDPDAGKGSLIVQSAAHLRLDSQDPEAYIREHLTGGDSSYVPDAFAFNLIAGGDVPRKDGRIVIAVSALFDGSVFVDYAAEYTNPQFTLNTVTALRSDYFGRLAQLGLAEKKGEVQK